MLRSSIVNVLGYGLVILISLSLNACAFWASKPRKIEISAKPVKKPELVLPPVDRLNMKTVKWMIITEKNYQEVFADLKKSGRPLAIFGLTDRGYENLSLNTSAIRALVQQQKAIIAAYEAYYKRADTSLDQANQEIENVKAQVLQQENKE